MRQLKLHFWTYKGYLDDAKGLKQGTFLDTF